MNALTNCENMFGELSPQIKKKIKKFITKPTFENWDDIHCIIITHKGMRTIWNAVIEKDSTFPKQGRVEDLKGNIIKEWERIPTPFDVLKAIKEMTK